MSNEDLQRDIGKLWGAHRELASVVWGDDVTRDNGLRSEVRAVHEDTREIRKEIKRLEEWGQEIWHTKRREECLGLEAIAEHKRNHEQKEGENVALKTVKMQSSTQLWVNTILTAGALIAALITAVFK